MLKKLIPTIFMLTCVMFASGSAQTVVTPEKQAAIKELVALQYGDNNMEDMMKAMIPQMQAQQDATMKASLDAQTGLTAAEKQALAESIGAENKHSIKRLMDRMMQKINYNELVNEIAYSVYDKYFTLEEVKDLSAFYKSPTGQKFLKQMTPIMTDMMTMMHERVMPKMMIVIKEMMDEDKAEIEQKINARKAKPKKAISK
ncbi:MAG TPA: DUF2059 domain-containing protein [Pyrinomonadaceae bacterium]